jgi:hypothetical protein
MVKKYVFSPRSFLVINVCNLGKTLCSPCTTELHIRCHYSGRFGHHINVRNRVTKSEDVRVRVHVYHLSFGWSIYLELLMLSLSSLAYSERPATELSRFTFSQPSRKRSALFIDELENYHCYTKPLRC